MNSSKTEKDYHWEGKKSRGLQFKKIIGGSIVLMMLEALLSIVRVCFYEINGSPLPIAEELRSSFEVPVP